MRPAIQKTSRALRSTVLALMVLFIAACGANNAGIFYFIEIEEPEIDNSLPNTITALGMGKVGTDYYVSAGLSVWSRPVGGTTWSKITMPPGESYVGALVDYSGDLYEGTLNGLYSNKHTVWTAVSDASVDG